MTGARSRWAVPSNGVYWRCCWPTPVMSCPSTASWRRYGRGTARRTARRATTRTYVSRLRGALGDGFVVTREPGYLIDVAGATFDKGSFEELVTQARRAEPAVGRAV